MPKGYVLRNIMHLKSNNSFTFLIFKLPVALIGIIIVFELFAYFLLDYRAIRHGLDRKVAKIENLPHVTDIDFIFFGDSVSKDIADNFDIIPERKNALNHTNN